MPSMPNIDQPGSSKPMMTKSKWVNKDLKDHQHSPFNSNNQVSMFIKYFRSQSSLSLIALVFNSIDFLPIE